MAANTNHRPMGPRPGGHGPGGMMPGEKARDFKGSMKKLLGYLAPYLPGIGVALVCAWYLFRTKTGLNVQAIGENPGAADAASIDVTRWKYVNILLGGGICGIGGAYCSMIINGGVWLSDSVGGLGWIAVALVIFAAWKPHMAIWGSLVFGALRVLEYYVPQSMGIPAALYKMLPFLMTALVLVISSMRRSAGSRIPGSLGVNYFREER